MTDPTAPTPGEPDHVHPDVELASAHLDDEVSAEERARVQSDPELRAHADAFAAVAQEIRDVPPPPPGAIDDHVTAALAELHTTPTRASGGVVPLARRPQRGQPWWQRAPLGAVAAVLVVVALLGVVGLASLAGDEDDMDTAATAVEDSGDAADAGADGSDESVDDDALLPDPATDFGEESSGGGGTAAADRPQFASYDELADQLDAELSTTADAAPDEQDGSTEDATTEDAEGGDVLRAETGDPCGAVDLLGLDPAAVETVLLAVVAGEPVTAVVHADDDGSRLVVVADATCEVVLDRSL